MKKLMLLFIVSMIANTMFAQQIATRQKIAVLNLDTHGLGITPSQAGKIARLELDRLNMFDVIDRYDIDFLLDKDSLSANKCYGKLCLVEIAKKIKADKMISGSIELLGERVVVTLRMVDVATVSVEKTEVLDFLNVPEQAQSMLALTLKKMFKVTYDEAVYNQLTKVNSFETNVNLPNEDRVNLSGPRMGMALFTGKSASRLKESEATGGFDLSPTMFQFGYQMEVQYLGQGDFQALAEFLPMISGIDQGKVIPSLTILNGLRQNKYGFELAFGPSFFGTREALGYYDTSIKDKPQWKLAEEYTSTTVKNPFTIEKRTDSRGTFKFTTGFIIAVGKTFRSGRLNIPINAYVKPNRKEGSQFGISLGFNARSGKSRKKTNLSGFFD